MNYISAGNYYIAIIFGVDPILISFFDSLTSLKRDCVKGMTGYITLMA